MAETSRCLICGSGLSESVSFSSVTLNLSSISKLSKSLEVYFFLKHVLSLPDHLIGSCLGSSEDLQQLAVCGNCNFSYLTSCVALFKDLLEVHRKLKEIRNLIVDVVKVSVELDDSESNGLGQSVWREVRHFVKQYNFVDAAVDFRYGDLQAKEKWLSILPDENTSDSINEFETIIKEEDIKINANEFVSDSDWSPPASPSHVNPPPNKGKRVKFTDRHKTNNSKPSSFSIIKREPVTKEEVSSEDDASSDPDWSPPASPPLHPILKKPTSPKLFSQDITQSEECSLDAAVACIPSSSSSQVSQVAPQKQTTSKTLTLSNPQYTPCDECDYVAPYPSALQKHKMRYHTTDLTPFTCTVCKHVYSTTAGLQIHLNSGVHSEKPETKLKKRTIPHVPRCEEEYYYCTECDFRSGNQLVVHDHNRQKHGIKPSIYTCDICNVTISQWVVFRKHMSRVHSVRDRFESAPQPKRYKNPIVPIVTCPDCGKPIRGEHKLKIHRISHLPPSERQSECEKLDIEYNIQTEYHDNLRRENFKDPKETTPVKCHICEQFVNGPLALYRHIYYNHRPKQEVACESCGALFTAGAALGRHQVAAHSVCFIVGCREKCEGKEELWKHQMEVHKEETYIWKCKQCGNLFSAMGYFKRHLERHAAKEGNKGEGGDFVCEICGKGFAIRDYLRYHIAHTHEGRMKKKKSKVVKNSSSSTNSAT